MELSSDESLSEDALVDGWLSVESSGGHSWLVPQSSTPSEDEAGDTQEEAPQEPAEPAWLTAAASLVSSVTVDSAASLVSSVTADSDNAPAVVEHTDLAAWQQRAGNLTHSIPYQLGHLLGLLYICIGDFGRESTFFMRRVALAVRGGGATVWAVMSGLEIRSRLTSGSTQFIACFLIGCVIGSALLHRGAVATVHSTAAGSDSGVVQRHPPASWWSSLPNVTVATTSTAFSPSSIAECSLELNAVRAHCGRRVRRWHSRATLHSDERADLHDELSAAKASLDASQREVKQLRAHVHTLRAAGAQAETELAEVTSALQQSHAAIAKSKAACAKADEDHEKARRAEREQWMHRLRQANLDETVQCICDESPKPSVAEAAATKRAEATARNLSAENERLRAALLEARRGAADGERARRVEREGWRWRLLHEQQDKIDEQHKVMQEQAREVKSLIRTARRLSEKLHEREEEISRLEERREKDRDKSRREQPHQHHHSRAKPHHGSSHEDKDEGWRGHRQHQHWRQDKKGTGHAHDRSQLCQWQRLHDVLGFLNSGCAFDFNHWFS